MTGRFFKTLQGAVIASLASLAAVSSATAGPISTLTDPAVSARCMCSPNVLAQSFTAEDPFVDLTVQGGEGNPHVFTGPLLFNLDFREGDGLGGTLLDSFSFAPTVGDFSLQLFTFDLSHIALNVGSQYTFVLTSANNRGITGRTLHGEDIYAGGRAIRGDNGTSFGELGFAVTPISAPPPPPASGVPAPGALMILGFGLFGLGMRRRTA